MHDHNENLWAEVEASVEGHGPSEMSHGLAAKLASLTPAEWGELTHRMTEHFIRQMERLGYELVRRA